MLQEIDVTFGTTANSSHARGDANPALMAALAVSVIAAATLAGAWFFQLVLDIRPCPLCLEQRYAYYLAFPLGFLVAFAASRGAPRSRKRDEKTEREGQIIGIALFEAERTGADIQHQLEEPGARQRRRRNDG